MKNEKLPKKVVAQLSDDLLQQFKNLSDREIAAEQMLKRTTKEQREAWDKVAKNMI